MQRRNYRHRHLNDEPANHCVGDRNFVNVAPLQFGEEVAFFHCLFCGDSTFAGSIPIRRKRSAKRGSERSGRNSGWDVKLTIEAECSSNARSSQRKASSFSPSAAYTVAIRSAATYWWRD